MSISVGQAILYLGGDDSALQSDLAGAEQKTHGVLGRVGGFLSNAFSVAVGGLIQQGINSITGSIGGLVSGMVQGNAEFETYQTQFGILLGSADKAKQRLSDLADFGAKTPFELPEVVRADKVLTSFGLDAEDTAQRFGVSAAQIRTTIGDVASGTGAGFEEISNLMGRFASGATGEAISRFQELGIATREQMAGWGLQFNKAGQLLTPAREAFTVLESHLRDKFGGMMDAQSKTFSGMLSNLEDWKGQTLRKIGAPIFEVLKDKLGMLLGFLGSPAVQGAIDKFATFLAGAIGQAVDWLNTAINWAIANLPQIAATVSSVFGAVQGQIGGVMPLIDGMRSALVQVVGWVVANWPQISATVGTAIGMLVAYFGQVFATVQAVWPQVQAIIMTALQGAWAVIQQVVGMIVTFWQNNHEHIQSTIATAWTRIQSIIQTVLPLIQQIVQSVFSAVSTFLQTHGAEIQQFLTQAWNQISTIIQLAISVIQATIIPAFQAVAKFLSAHGTEIQTVLGGAWNIIKGVIKVALDLIQGILTVALDIFQGNWSGAWNAIKATVGKVWDDIKIVIGGALTILETALGGAWARIRDGASSAWNGIKNAIVNAFNGITQPIRDALNSVIDAMNSAIRSFNALPGPDIGLIPHLAMGTAAFAGGLALVGENGPELVGLPSGARVWPSSTTAGLGGPNYNIHIDARGSELTEAQIQARFEAALRAVPTALTTARARGMR
jgi:phage-related protein